MVGRVGFDNVVRNKIGRTAGRPQGTSYGRLLSTVGEIPIEEHPHSRRGP